MPEHHIDAVLMKLMKYRELDRKLTERQPIKDGLVYEAEQVLTATGKLADFSCFTFVCLDATELLMMSSFMSHSFISFTFSNEYWNSFT